jgi:hypothetical protein
MITIKGKKYHFKFGINAADLYCELRKCDLNKFQEDVSSLSNGKINIGVFRDLIWACIKAGELSAGNDFEYNNFQVGDLLSEMTNKEFEQIINEIGKQAAGNEKKRAVKTKS